MSNKMPNYKAWGLEDNLKTANVSNKKHLSGRIQQAINSVKHNIRAQSVTFLAVSLAEFSAFLLGYSSAAYSLAVLVLLSAVIYSSLSYGLKRGLVSAAIVLLYNTLHLSSATQTLSLNDPNFRRIAILLVAFPLLAYVIGRLKERNDLLLKNEKEARERAEASEKRWRFLAESMPQKVFTNTPDGVTDYSNPQWMEYTGLRPEALSKNNWSNIIHPEDRKENVLRWQKSIKTGEPFAFEHRLRRHDGAYRWHISRSHAMRDKSGNIVMWVGSSTDIHDIKQALEREQNLEKTTARLSEQREQLLALNKAKDEFISLASHQLRTPATGVKQYIGVILEGYAGEITDQQRAFLKQANESNERQITIINDLLKVAKVDAGKVTLHKEPCNLTTLLESILQEQHSKFVAKNQKVIFKPKYKKLTATADKSTARMVLENIIDNASKYTPAGGTIEINIGKSKVGISIAVRDEGVGIDKKDLDKVFQKFSRIENPLSIQVGGSGLGLYWAKKIVDLHGGNIDINSEIGKGSTFTVNLPL